MEREFVGIGQTSKLESYNTALVVRSLFLLWIFVQSPPPLLVILLPWQATITWVHEYKLKKNPLIPLNYFCQVLFTTMECDILVLGVGLLLMNLSIRLLFFLNCFVRGLWRNLKFWRQSLIGCLEGGNDERVDCGGLTYQVLQGNKNFDEAEFKNELICLMKESYVGRAWSFGWEGFRKLLEKT